MKYTKTIEISGEKFAIIEVENIPLTRDRFLADNDNDLRISIHYTHHNDRIDSIVIESSERYISANRENVGKIEESLINAMKVKLSGKRDYQIALENNGFIRKT